MFGDDLMSPRRRPVRENKRKPVAKKSNPRGRFDSDDFMTRVVSNLENKYKDLENEPDLIIELNTLTPSNQEALNNQADKEFGYYANGSLETIQRKSYNSNAVDMNSTRKSRRRNVSLEAYREPSTSANSLMPQLAKSVPNLSEMLSANANATPQYIIPRKHEFNFGSLQFDMEFQTRCLKELYSMVTKNDEIGRSTRMKLIECAKNTLGLPVLPICSTIIPFVHFSKDGDPYYQIVYNSNSDCSPFSLLFATIFGEKILRIQKNIYDIISTYSLYLSAENDKESILCDSDSELSEYRDIVETRSSSRFNNPKEYESIPSASRNVRSTYLGRRSNSTRRGREDNSLEYSDSSLLSSEYSTLANAKTSRMRKKKVVQRKQSKKATALKKKSNTSLNSIRHSPRTNKKAKSTSPMKPKSIGKRLNRSLQKNRLIFDDSGLDSTPSSAKSVRKSGRRALAPNRFSF